METGMILIVLGVLVNFAAYILAIINFMYPTLSFDQKFDRHRILSFAVVISWLGMIVGALLVVNSLL